MNAFDEGQPPTTDGGHAMSSIPATPGAQAQPEEPHEGARMDRTITEAPRTLDDRLETAGYGFLFLLIAALALPSGMTEYVAVAGVGALLLGLNAVRMAVGIPVGWFSITAGTWAVIAGLGAMAGLKIDVFALFFLLLGLVALGAALRSR